MRGQHRVETRVEFIGRSAELARLERALAQRSCIVLVGPGGVGKSRLALEAVERFEAAGGQAVFVSLAGVAPAAVASAIVETVGLVPEGGQAPLEALSAPRPLDAGAIVLDNAEDAVAEVGAALERLRARGDVAVVVTSRTPLDARLCPDVLEVEPFDEEAGSAFFAARARLANVAVDADGKDRDAVHRIVNRLDGLAVAIDLAAARLASLSVETLAEELAHPHPIHFRSSASREPRHRTLNRVVEWSLSKLDDEARAAFIIAGRFATSFTAADLQTVLGPVTRDAAAILEELADQSLLVRGADGYSMLVPIRTDAKRRLERTPGRRKIEERFARRMAELAALLKDRAEQQTGGTPMAEIARRYDDFTSALGIALQQPQERLAAALDVFGVLVLLWTDGGRWSDGLRWCDRVVAESESLEPLQRARVHYMALRVAYVACDYARMLSLGPQLVTAFTVAGDRLGLARAYNGLAVASMYTGRFDKAKTYAATSLALYRAVGHDIGVASALMNQGSIALEGDRDPEAASALYHEGLEIARRSGREAMIALAFGNLAEAAYFQRDAGGAERYAREALAHLDRTGDESRMIWVHHSLARAELARYAGSLDSARLDAAQRELETALALAERHFHADYVALCLETCARILAERGDFAVAARTAAGARRIRRERRVASFGLTLDEAQVQWSRIESQLPPGAGARAEAEVEGVPLESLPQAARSALAQSVDRDPV